MRGGLGAWVELLLAAVAGGSLLVAVLARCDSADSARASERSALAAEHSNAMGERHALQARAADLEETQISLVTRAIKDCELRRWLDVGSEQPCEATPMTVAELEAWSFEFYRWGSRVFEVRKKLRAAGDRALRDELQKVAGMGAWAVRVLQTPEMCERARLLTWQVSAEFLAALPQTCRGREPDAPQAALQAADVSKAAIGQMSVLLKAAERRGGRPPRGTVDPGRLKRPELQPVLPVPLPAPPDGR